MIIVNLKGGLGNQLFQYACGRALCLRQQEASKDKVSLKLDISGYSENNGIDTMRHYSLAPFNIKAEMATNKEIKKLKYPYGYVSKGFRFFKVKVMRQFNTNFVPSIFKTRGSIYLDGFFQTEKYFMDKEEEIRNDFLLKEPLSQIALEIHENIQGIKNSVSLHVRRSDYVSDQKTNQHHGTCNPEYYSKALEYITSKIGRNINVFIFSDDINWAKGNIPISYPAIYVSLSGAFDYEELILMSRCNHHIIANSSFSWWGAWLGRNSDKIIVAPKNWVRTNEKWHKDIVPDSWIRV